MYVNNIIISAVAQHRLNISLMDKVTYRTLKTSQSQKYRIIVKSKKQIYSAVMLL